MVFDLIAVKIFQASKLGNISVRYVFADKYKKIRRSISIIDVIDRMDFRRVTLVMIFFF